MSTLSLRIQLEGGRVTKTIQFHPNTTVFDACKIIRDKFAEAVQGQRKYLLVAKATDTHSLTTRINTKIVKNQYLY